MNFPLLFCGVLFQIGFAILTSFAYQDKRQSPYIGFAIGLVFSIFGYAFARFMLTEGNRNFDAFWGKLVGNSIMYILLTFFALIAIIPFGWMITQSLMTNPEAQAARRILPAVPQWGNYIEAWSGANFGKYFFNSAIISSVSIVGTLIITILAGYAFARVKFMGRDLMFTLLLMTLMIPEAVTMIPNFLTINAQIVPLPNIVTYQIIEREGEEGLIVQHEYTEERVNIRETDNVRSFPFLAIAGSWMDSLQGLTVPFLASAFSIFLLRQFFAQIPDELWDAARLDGAEHFRFLIQICLPIARPAILTVTLLTFIGSWNAFLWPIIITRTDEWRPIVVGLYNFRQEGGQQTHLLMAASFITILPMMILYFVAQKSFTEGLATSGLKG